MAHPSKVLAKSMEKQITTAILSQRSRSLEQNILIRKKNNNRYDQYIQIIKKEKEKEYVHTLLLLASPSSL